MDRIILERIASARDPFALVTIVEVKGSAPRHPGSAMFVDREGSAEGTIGGGKGEARAIDAAREAIRTRGSSVIDVEMLGSDAEGRDMICGGVNRMLVEYVGDAAPYRRAAGIVAGGRKALIRRVLDRAVAGPCRVALEISPPDARDPARRPGAELPGEADAASSVLFGGKAVLLDGGVFLDAVLPKEKLLILGGGHVGLALANAARDLEWEITVVDDREEFARAGRFAPGVNTISGGYEASIDAFPFDPATYAVILSRGHLFDLECARAVLRRQFRYAGLIGSKRKTALLREQLARDGFAAGTIASLHAPIGIDIGAETPAEIAVSIVAEMIAVRRKGG